MALSLDDRLLGEKLDYYCSSSEDEGGAESDADDGDESGKPKVQREIEEPQQTSFQTVPGQCVNTGPKGVVQDWRRFRQLEHEKREEQERERVELSKKFAVTCRPFSEDEKAKVDDEEFTEMLENVEGLEDFLTEYRLKRLEELKKSYTEIPRFGKVVNMNADTFVTGIDKESPLVTILIHIYEDNNRACAAVNGCFEILAGEYLTVKFCRIRASDAHMSRRFMRDGVPAILVYKAGDLIGNLVRISKELGDDFFAPDLESYLNEHGFLPDHPSSDPVLRISSIRPPLVTNDSDSDFDLD